MTSIFGPDGWFEFIVGIPLVDSRRTPLGRRSSDATPLRPRQGDVPSVDLRDLGFARFEFGRLGLRGGGPFARLGVTVGGGSLWQVVPALYERLAQARPATPLLGASAFDRIVVSRACVVGGAAVSRATIASTGPVMTT